MNLEFGRLYIDTNEELPVIERYAGNMYLYRYDLRLEESVEEDETNLKRYSFVEVRLQGYPNRNETIKNLIHQLVSSDDEMKLNNDYNEVMNFEDNPKETDAYKEYMKYLNFRKEIRTKVNVDFDDSGY